MYKQEFDVKGLRHRLGLRQDEFTVFGPTLDQIRCWEQGKSRPTGAALALLLLIDRDHDTVMRILAEPPKRYR